MLKLFQFNIELAVGFGASTSEVRVVQSVVSDRSHLTLRKVIDEIMSKQSDERNMASIAVKTICERYLVATAVSAAVFVVLTGT